MKKLLLIILSKAGHLLRWKWLYLIAGIALISVTQSCDAVNPMCYDPAIPQDSTQVNENDSILNPIHNNAEMIDDSARTPIE